MNKTLQNIVIAAVAVVVVAGIGSFYLSASSNGERPTAAAAPVAAKGCWPDKFDIAMKGGSREKFAAHFFAELTNNNAVACGVQMQVKVFDKGGNLIVVDEPWPASVRNIAPGQSYTFDHMLSGDNAERADHATMSAINAKAW